MSAIINILLLILMLGIIIFIHELGHFIFAKLFKVYVHEFAIGMGPKLFSKKREGDETEYTIRALPLGGFNSIAGESEEDESDKDVPEDMLLYKKKPWQKAIILAAGATFNIILAYLLILLFSFIKTPMQMTTELAGVKDNSPAYVAGLRKGDKIEYINNKRTKTSSDVNLQIMLSSYNKKGAPSMKVKVKGKDPVNITAALDTIDGQKSYYYGLEFKDKKDTKFGAHLRYTHKQFTSIFRQMGVTFKLLFTGKAKLKDLSGPVGMYKVVGSAKAKAGLASLLLLTALISINVGLINLLPFPAFDGGYLFILLIETITGKKVPAKLTNALSFIGFALIILLSIFVFVSDIGKL